MPSEDDLSEQEKRDCQARLHKACEELNAQLKRAAELGMPQKVGVYTADESVQTHDLRPMPANVIKLPQKKRGRTYRQVLLLPKGRRK